MDSLTHPIDPLQRHEQVRAILTTGHPRAVNLDESSVTICNDAWVGAGATILRGVVIGEAAIVGAGAIVTHDVPPFTIVAGNPAKAVGTVPR